jgi:hypothetical protein
MCMHIIYTHNSATGKYYAGKLLFLLCRIRLSSQNLTVCVYDLVIELSVLMEAHGSWGSQVGRHISSLSLID